MPELTSEQRRREEVAELVDAAVDDVVVVYGSLPPDGTDLDVVARPPEVRGAAAALDRHGFTHHGDEWVRFASGSAVAVELATVDEWGLAPATSAALFADAVPLPGRRHLARPSPHHTLLLLAERFARDGGLGAGADARLAQALAEDPDAWSLAAHHAPAWRSTRALDLLAAHHRGDPVSVADRAAAVAEELAQRSMPPLERRVRSWVAATRTSRDRGAIVAFSGLDGSGKSSQATALAAALVAVGQPAVVEWARLAYDPLLARLAAPVKRLLGRRADDGGDDASTLGDAGTTRIDAETGDATPRHVLLDALWAVVVALVDSRAHRARVRRHVRDGRVVVCDRYLLDSTVHLQERFTGMPLRLAVVLARLLTPSPRRAFYLRVTPETAYARKPQEFVVARLRRQAANYEQWHDALGVTVLDGTRDPDELATEIGTDVWLALRETRRSGLVRRR